MFPYSHPSRQGLDGKLTHTLTLKTPIHACSSHRVYPLKKSWLFGFMYGMSTGVIFLMYAGVFYFSAWLIQEEILPASKFEDIFKVLMALVFGAMTAGQSGAMAPDFGEAKLSANRIMKLLNTESKIDPENEGGKKPAKGMSQLFFESAYEIINLQLFETIVS